MRNWKTEKNRQQVKIDNENIGKGDRNVPLFILQTKPNFLKESFAQAAYEADERMENTL